MTITDYFSSLTKNTTKLILVGPLYEGAAEFNDPVIYIDGGASYKSSKGFSVGDGDSYSGKLNQLLPKDKDYSDLSFVLKNIPISYNQVELLGFLGGRKDHELINLAEVHTHLKKKEIHRKCLFDNHIIAFSKGEWSLAVHGVFTVFTFEQRLLELTGNCEYEVSESIKPLSSQGLSNIGSGNLVLKTDGPVFVFLN